MISMNLHPSYKRTYYKNVVQESECILLVIMDRNQVNPHKMEIAQ